jgi:hypothetical protein
MHTRKFFAILTFAIYIHIALGRFSASVPIVPMLHSIENRLQSFTANKEASIFAVFTPNNEFKFYSTGLVTQNSIIRFGSITKIFVGYLALKHRLNLENKPVDYGFGPDKYSGSNLQTFRDLGGHKSGISEYATAKNLLNDNSVGWRYGGNFTVKRDINLGWKDKPLDFIPTTKYCYSNTNCEVVGDVLEIITGQSVSSLITNTFSNIMIDNGKNPLSVWPQTPVYLKWPYPTTMPGVSGSLIGTTEGLLRSYKIITQSREFQLMQNWHYDKNDPMEVPQCPPGSIGYNIAGGDRYGFFLQHFSADKIYDGLAQSMTSRLADNGSLGHDGNLIVRSILIIHPTGNIFFYHYTDFIENAELQRRLSTLITEFLVY